MYTSICLKPICVPCMYSAPAGQKRMLDPQEVEIQMIVNCQTEPAFSQELLET